MSADEGPKLRQLYLFDWSAPIIKHGPTEGTQLGWWDGRNWVGAFSVDGMWSASLIIGYRPVGVWRESTEADEVEW